MTLEFVLDFQRWGGGEPTAVGEGYSCTYNGRYYSVLFTRAGMFRGNHVHPHMQHTLLLEGKGRYVFEEKDGTLTSHPLRAGKIFNVQPGIPHIFLPRQDCLTVEWWDGPFVADEHDFPRHTVGIKKKMAKFERQQEKLRKAKK